MVRGFVGIGLSSLSAAIGRVSEELKGACADAKFVEPENLHVNLKFLGEFPPERVEPLSAALEDVALHHAPFTLSVRTTGYFPDLRKIRVIWLGLEPLGPLASLHRDVDQAAGKVGFKAGGRRYRPHVTLARVKSGRNKEALLAALERMKDVDVGMIEVPSFSLIRSTLTPSGPVYAPLSTHRLHTPAD